PSPSIPPQSRSTPGSPMAPGFRSQLLSPSPSSGPSSRTSPGHSRPTQLAPPVKNLPEVLGWLRDVCFELWIDQEGFRAIRPKFRLSDYASPTSGSSFPPSLADTLTNGIAVFTPTRRQSSVYHHGALDSAPVLRRLTLAGNEEKDYISRHASLTIKSNGVYAVTGTEWFDDPAHASGSGHGGEPLRLRWRFQYAVDDLPADGSKRASVNGEKTFIPLSFSCSPGLLHPTHGKPIKLIHVLKKNMTPKLSARR
ncbi:hypothetical protein OH77DRAFT_1364735, partial [Trametes cingulata]